MEISAKKTNKVFSLDKIDFEKQPRAQRVSDRTRADQRRAGRSNFGNLKDAAQTHAGRYTKLGFKSIQDRMEKDPFYLFNNAVGQITPDCCQFLEDLAKCIAPDVGRTREKREKQLGTGVSTRLIFMPDFNRDIRLPLDVTKEAMVAHHARVFTLPQFAVLAADLLKARGEPTPMLFGWSGSVLPVDQASAQDCFFDFVDFAKRQWKEQYNNIKGEEHSFVDEATASDVAEFPLARSSKTGTGEGREGYRRHFDPIQKPAKGKGKGYGQQQRPIFQQAIECWKCGQYGHKSFECRGGWSRGQQWGSYGSYSSRSGRAGPMAKLELESGLLWPRLDCWSLGEIDSIELIGSSSGASAATSNGNACAWRHTSCWRFCPSCLWISPCSRASTTGTSCTSCDCRGVLRDQRPATLQAHLQWWDGRIWILVDVSHLMPWFYAYRKVWPIGWKLTYGHSVQSNCTYFQNLKFQLD